MEIKYINDASTKATIDFFGFCMHGYTKGKSTVYNCWDKYTVPSLILPTSSGKNGAGIDWDIWATSWLRTITARTCFCRLLACSRPGLCAGNHSQSTLQEPGAS